MRVIYYKFINEWTVRVDFTSKSTMKWCPCFVFTAAVKGELPVYPNYSDSQLLSQTNKSNMEDLGAILSEDIHGNYLYTDIGTILYPEEERYPHAPQDQVPLDNLFCRSWYSMRIVCRLLIEPSNDIGAVDLPLQAGDYFQVAVHEW